MKNKFVLLATILLLVLAVCFCLNSCSSTNLLQFKLNEDGQSYSVSKFNGTSENIDIDIPALYNNKPVTKINDFVFASNEYIQSIQLSENINEVSNLAFTGSSMLDRITVNEKNIHFTDDEGVLYNKEKTKLLCFPPKWNGVVFDAQSGSGVVYKLPDSVVEIGDCAFYKATSVVELILPPGLKEIGDSAFLRCVNMKKINLPRGLQKIEKDAFLYCQGLDKIIIPESVTEINDYAFSYANNLQAIYMERSEADKNAVHLGKDWVPHKKDKINDLVEVIWSYEEGKE